HLRRRRPRQHLPLLLTLRSTRRRIGRITAVSSTSTTVNGIGKAKTIVFMTNRKPSANLLPAGPRSFNGAGPARPCTEVLHCRKCRFRRRRHLGHKIGAVDLCHQAQVIMPADASATSLLCEAPPESTVYALGSSRSLVCMALSSLGLMTAV